MPCQAVDPAGRDYHNRCLRPNARSLRRVRELITEEEEVRLADYRQQRREAAIDNWRGALFHQGNEAFFRLGAELRRASSVRAASV